MQAGDLLVEVLGQHVDAHRVVVGLGEQSIWASTWLVKEFDITNDGWPVALPRFDQPALGQHDDGVAGREGEQVDLLAEVDV